jgi:hypothetical protein
MNNRVHPPKRLIPTTSFFCLPRFGQVAIVPSPELKPTSEGERRSLPFKLKGGLNAEQLLTPLPPGRSALSNTKVKQFGITVATTDAIVRKI